MIELTKTQKIIIAVGIICILMVIGIFLYKRTQDVDYSMITLEQEDKKENVVNQNTLTDKKIKVHVVGYVEEEGIVELEEGARIADAIDAAGGATLEADLSKINLAFVLQDGQKIYIPSILDENLEEETEEYITEKSGTNILEGGTTSEENGKVNINTATQTELETLSRNRSFYS